jgi:uncharacterized protein YprB with RNaseH-like and TPR domain
LEKTKSAKSQLFLNPNNYKVGLIDIETTGLKGDFDIILCGVIKTWGNNKHKVHKINLNRRDLLSAEKRFLEKLISDINSYDGVIGYYSSGFDMPMIRTRCFYHGLKPPQKIKHLDMYYTIKRIVNTGSRRMERINELITIPGTDYTTQKTKIDMRQWMSALFAHDTKALSYIVDHCIKDVDILEEITNRFIDFVPDRIIRR